MSPKRMGPVPDVSMPKPQTKPDPSLNLGWDPSSRKIGVINSPIETLIDDPPSPPKPKLKFAGDEA